ncbi:MAG TPA: type II toxin-antitoxin system RelE/ParE family toxin [Anaerolineaceae bacterium]|nr:type II toxin-antitoxin system RelE/ParE family toxin [Anaerolineaceae bacterium]
MKTIWMKKAQKYLDKSPKSLQKKVEAALSEIEKVFPNVLACQNVEKLQGEPNSFRCRVGAYRIVFMIDGEILYIALIGPRGDVYKS